MSMDIRTKAISHLKGRPIYMQLLFEQPILRMTFQARVLAFFLETAYSEFEGRIFLLSANQAILPFLSDEIKSKVVFLSSLALEAQAGDLVASFSALLPPPLHADEQIAIVIDSLDALQFLHPSDHCIARLLSLLPSLCSDAAFDLRSALLASSRASSLSSASQGLSSFWLHVSCPKDREDVTVEVIRRSDSGKVQVKTCLLRAARDNRGWAFLLEDVRETVQDGKEENQEEEEDREGEAGGGSRRHHTELIGFEGEEEEERVTKPPPSSSTAPKQREEGRKTSQQPKVLSFSEGLEEEDTDDEMYEDDEFTRDFF